MLWLELLILITGAIFYEGVDGGSNPVIETEGAGFHRVNITESVWTDGETQGGEHGLTLRMAVLAPGDPNHEQSLVKILPAIWLGVRGARQAGLLPPGTRVHVHHKDSRCSSTYGPLAAFELHNLHSPSVFLGPVCDYVIAPVARFAGVWGVPVVTAGGQAAAFQHKVAGQFPTLVRLMGSYSAVGSAMQSILRQFGWSVAGLLYHNHRVGSAKGHSLCHFALAAVFSALNSTPAHRSFDQEATSSADYRELLKDVARSARIVVVCANQTAVREILLAADDLNMVGSGDYVFFNIDLYSSDSGNASRQPWYLAGDSEARNNQARRAYEALLTVTARKPHNPEYDRFSSQVRQLAVDSFNYSYGEEEEVSTFVTAFHDAVLLYAVALNQTLAFNGSQNDGRLLTRAMWNRTFQGIAGDVTIDENGDRVADYSLLDLDPETDSFQVVAHYLGRSRNLLFEPGKRVQWAGERTSPPLDVPECGFDGSLCPDTSVPGYAIFSMVLSVLVILLSAISFFSYRRFKLEAEIAEMTWRVSWGDVVLLSEGRTAPQGNNKSRGSIKSLSKSDRSVGISEDAASLADLNRQQFVPTAIYKGSKVAIKSLPATRIELTRPLLLELKKMRDLHHAHLVRFIGACLDTPHCALLTEYCPRGSLQDILEHEQIQLDWLFRYSLMHDLVKGMCYLHDSDIRTHGKLKSSNCLVDSRFVLKIADFGLVNLRNATKRHHRTHQQLQLPPQDHAFWAKQLWTAPELLRLGAAAAPEGTQKGDVYSFGIIMHEIVTRQGPFFLPDRPDIGPKEIVEGVSAVPVSRPPLRPSMNGLKCEPQVAQLMTRCWAEDYAERPDFPAIRASLRRLNSGPESSQDILDNLLTRMEQYANNLEALVEERTADYLEEKRKCEELLYQLLPRSVASQLIQGQSVSAETYDSVTIYFSDIVGFTALSAHSTPLQVVDLLNDLYTCFDSIIENFDVYKVETIGDAYMVVSGLPVRNGTRHAREIARMALALLNAVLGFVIRHRPGEQLKLRIGLHTGPCVAGVVGLKMPRYCLFGDTVNTASRMESNGMPLKIHVSSSTKAVLDTFSTFRLELRGDVEMKGKGKMTTYWLEGESECDASPLICNLPPRPAPTQAAAATNNNCGNLCQQNSGIRSS